MNSQEAFSRPRWGRARLRQRVQVEHALAHIGRWQGDRAHYHGQRKNLFDLPGSRSSTTSTSSPASHTKLNKLLNRLPDRLPSADRRC
jgi:hypothetical protein